MNIEQKVRELIEKPINDNNYIIDNLEYVKEGNTYFLRVFIDKQGIIDIEDCITVSNIINPILDDEDLIKDYYVLDVCSKGGNEDEQ
ncbi:MAG: hypothetical protein PHN42_01485 [Bacilli bacterium]|nr:hypothetical protein [Bacilli bacterium]